MTGAARAWANSLSSNAAASESSWGRNTTADSASSTPSRTATAFGLIWAGLDIASGLVANSSLSTVVDLYAKDPAQATSVWLALDSVAGGLGGGIRILGALWVLLVSWAALRAGGLPRALNYLGVVIGVAGLLTVVPALGELGGIIFGLGFIVWFGWVGIVMLSPTAFATR